jgi:hypothetical protein
MAKKREAQMRIYFILCMVAISFFSLNLGDLQAAVLPEKSPSITIEQELAW